MSVKDKAAAIANKLNAIDFRYKVSAEDITAKATESEIAFFYEKLCKGAMRYV